jgi:hypothetical protein
MATRTAPKRSGAKPLEQIRERTKEPVLGVTKYDNARSFMLALVISLLLGVGFLFLEYLSNRVPVTKDQVALELVEIPGGYEDGSIDETLKVDSPEPPTDDASLTEVDSEVTEMEETLENVIDVSDQVSSQAPPQYEMDYQNTGKRGSASGTGRRPLGSGGGSGAGFPREQRWYVRFSDSGTLDTYAEQLDFFKIQFGVLNPDGQLIYVSNFTKAKPDTQVVSTGKNEKRLYMTWQGGGRKQADIQLFQKAGVDARRGTIFHFYPPNVENMLAQLERDYRNKPATEIRRTYFVVEPEGSGYKFTVTRQTYLN